MEKQGFLNRMKETLILRGWSLLKVPLINIIGPRVQVLNDEECSILIPLNYLTKNHFNSMYISVQVTGADLGAGLLATHHIRKRGNTLSLIFKDLSAKFLKRPDGDTVFTCTDGKEIEALVEDAVASGKREERRVTILARCPKKYGDEVLSEFQLTLSIKKKAK